MKKMLSITAIGIFALTSTLSQAATKKFPITIKTSPLVLIDGSYSGEIDLGVTNHISVGIKGEYVPKIEKDSTILDGKGKGFGIKGNFYSNGVQKNGVYTSAEVQIANLQGKALVKDNHLESNRTEMKDFSANFFIERYSVGYKWNTNQGLSTQVGAGFQKLQLLDISTSDPIYNPIVEFNVGYTI